MSSDTQNTPWLHRFSIANALATFVLIGFGGLVTSKGVGMAVPDWPNTFGYNMFLVPFDEWLGKFGVFEEHSHRLVASFIGLLTTILAVWLWLKDDRKWVRLLGLGAFLLVVAQGVLGGLRVTEINQNLGLIHGAVAQLFLVLVCGIALVTSGWWRRGSVSQSNGAGFAALQGTLVVVICLMFVQLLLGATMRHQHAGLAIWDFPLAHGQVWPATDEISVAQYNVNRLELQKNLHSENRLYDAEGNPQSFLASGHEILSWHVWLQMLHRLGAVVTLAMAVVLVMKVRRRFGQACGIARAGCLLLAMVVAQASMGIWTILSNKAADVATGHVVLGAVCLALGSLLLMVTKRCEFVVKLAGAEESLAKHDDIGVRVAAVAGAASDING
ncbi:MAG TPA: COX15/CtaA family protein [Verrucomicrobiota bacterium]|jgi:cytochrome c oxidase assembly protein subunit 15|nr:COX15/CtaA family protein [Verrucomicrobiota bacterium]